MNINLKERRMLKESSYYQIAWTLDGRKPLGIQHEPASSLDSAADLLCDLGLIV